MRSTNLKLFLVGLLALSPLSLAGCGFTPVYTERQVGAGLANIELVTPDTRTGYFVRQKLLGSLKPNKTVQKPYILTIDIEERRYEIGLQVNDVATRSEQSSQVTYRLTDAETKKVLTTSSFTYTTTYDAVTASPYSGIVSQKDAQDRAATGIVERIERDLMLYFHQNSQKSQ
jgi:LPS-assembly lipoprotein